MSVQAASHRTRRTSRSAVEAALAFSAPGIFVFLWSTGFIAARLGLPYIEPSTFLAVRFAITVVLFGAIAVMLGARWPRRPREWLDLAIVGALMHGTYLGAFFYAMDNGIQAGAAALIAGLSPIVTAVLAGPLLGERVTLRQWLGLALGLVGATIVLWDRLSQGLGTPEAVVACCFGLTAIAVATIHQKKRCTGMDPWAGNTIQYMAAFAVVLAAALVFDTGAFEPTADLAIAMAWSVFGLSLGAILALQFLIRRGEASRVMSLFFLVPGTTAIIAWPLFGETVDLGDLVGIAVVAVGVALVTLKRRRLPKVTPQKS